MVTEIRQFCLNNREILGRISTLEDTRDVIKQLGELEIEHVRAIDKLARLNASDWEEMTAGWQEEEPELLRNVQMVRERIKKILQQDIAEEPFDWGTRIHKINCSSYLAIQSKSPFVRLNLATKEEKVIHFDQDLEDTLMLSGAILQSVKDIVDSLAELGVPSGRINWGTQFERVIEQMETDLKMLHTLFGDIEKDPTMQDDSKNQTDADKGDTNVVDHFLSQ